MKPIDWNDVVTKVISNLITIVFVGACAIVWQQATSVEKRVEDATSVLKVTIKVLQEELLIMKEELHTATNKPEPIDDIVAMDNVEDTSPHPEKISESASIIESKKYKRLKHDFLEQKIEQRAPRMMEQMSR